LWFTFEFLSLIKFFQWFGHTSSYTVCCDLLSNFYLWLSSFNIVGLIGSPPMLWFTFEFLSLIKFFQYSWVLFIPAIGCDLLSNFYLWLSSFNGDWPTDRRWELWFTFEFLSLIKFFQYWDLEYEALWCCDLLSNFYLWLSSFNNSGCRRTSLLLWFTFEFLSLIKFFQLVYYWFDSTSSCDLLSNFYLWLSSFNSLCC